VTFRPHFAIASTYTKNPMTIVEGRIWIDGCFDFAHHGHAGAMLQARQEGTELYVGVHSDEEILKHKGPVVMKLPERVIAVEGCRWCTKVVPNAPYVTDPLVMDQYGCKYVVHGDDITTDADGKDCYQICKDLGRFIVVKRTPNISTTDLVGRMLDINSHHHQGPISLNHPITDIRERVQSYASDPSGRDSYAGVYFNIEESSTLHEFVSPKNGYQKVVLVVGEFDLFHPGHIKFLQETQKYARSNDAKVIVGIYDDATAKNANYPIMNLVERSLCVLQSKYIDGLVIGAPKVLDTAFLGKIPGNVIKVVVNASDLPSQAQLLDPTLVHELSEYEYSDMTTSTIVNRVLDNRAEYEERQRKKGWKSELEQQLKQEVAYNK